MGSPSHGSWAVVLGVVGGALARVVNTFQHGEQVGMVLEMYRSNAGFFKLMGSIEANLRERDVERRENGELLEMKVALQLGRSLSELKDLADSSIREGNDIEEDADVSIPKSKSIQWHAFKLQAFRNYLLLKSSAAEEALPRLPSTYWNLNSISLQNISTREVVEELGSVRSDTYPGTSTTTPTPFVKQPKSPLKTTTSSVSDPMAIAKLYAMMEAISDKSGNA
ncbi:hypothetical protein RJ639_027015 [Escallonia herrerae]|uniref:Uncharacterized protein n=1 Tax=Escallonia herrerae TaxID=1293975 RepID=A0AA89BDR8_9ASTE|nr:hypothetical protein RJ639_027015 [Escallonia herrerae]